MGDKVLSGGAVDAFRRCKASFEAYLLSRLFLIRRILSALSFNP